MTEMYDPERVFVIRRDLIEESIEEWCLTMMTGTTDGSASCECHRCIKELDKGEDLGAFGRIPLSSTKMILCSECGNKRCQKATDHRLACTNSNETGQPGSIYESC